MSAAYRAAWRGLLCSLVVMAILGRGRIAVAQAVPATQPAGQIRTWIEQLGDPDAPVREKARDNLMCLKAVDLPTIRQVVADMAPRLKPSQKPYLRDIVFQLYISDIEYEPEPAASDEIPPQAKPKPRLQPFLGVRWPTQGTDFTIESASGVVIAQRIRGFAAYRTLRDGDVVTGIVEAPNATFTSSTEFSAALRNFNVGDTITFKVLRNGESMRVPVTLVTMPKGLAGMDQVSQEEWLQLREDRAEEYWKANFEPLVKADAAPDGDKP